MKKLLATAFMCFMVVGCSGGMNDGCAGWSAKEVTGSGQVKRVWKETPIICPDYHMIDISLGIMRNGIGSMSGHDMFLYLPDKDVAGLKKAAEDSSIIDFTYDRRRFSWCANSDRMTSFKIQK